MNGAVIFDSDHLEFTNPGGIVAQARSQDPNTKWVRVEPTFVGIRFDSEPQYLGGTSGLAASSNEFFWSWLDLLQKRCIFV